MGRSPGNIWRDLWPGRPWETVPIGHVTNGVHLATWMASPIMGLLDEHLGADWGARLDEPGFWDQVLTLDHQRLWETHVRLKQILANFVREEARRRFATQMKEAAQVVGAGTLLDPTALTIGFARRFATYKRANLIFRDLERLRRLLVDPWRPVQIIFAGKAHPADNPGKEVLQSVYQFTRDPEFEGRVAFLEDYDMHLAHLLVQGVDLWLNLPRVPLEASGHQRDEGGAQRDSAAEHARRLVAGGLRWAQRVGDLRRPARARMPTPPTPTASTGCSRSRSSRSTTRGTPPASRSAGWRRCATRCAWRAPKFTARRMIQDYVQEHYAPAIRGESSGDDPPDGLRLARWSPHSRPPLAPPDDRGRRHRSPSSTWRRNIFPTPAPAASPRP